MPSFLTYFDDLGFYSPEEPWLYSLLEEKVCPTALMQREGYTKKQMMDYLITCYRSGYTQYFGSPRAKTVLRCNYPNEYVVEPHIVGNAMAARVLIKAGIDFAFTSTKVRKINIYTHLPSVKGIGLRLGFTLEGTLTDTYLHNNSLTKIFILGLKKEDYALRSFFSSPL